MSAWKIIFFDGLDGKMFNYVKINDDGSCFVALPHDLSVVEWLAEGNTPEPWEETNGPE